MFKITKFYPKPDFSGGSIAGFAIKIDADGTFSVPGEYVESALAHGHIRASDRPAEKPNAEGLLPPHIPVTGRRMEVIDQLAKLPTDDLEWLLAEYEKAQKASADSAGPETHLECGEEDSRDTPTGFDPASITKEDVPALKRVELFAVLKERGGRVVPPCSNDDLRNAVLKTFEG